MHGGRFLMLLVTAIVGCHDDSPVAEHPRVVDSTPKTVDVAMFGNVAIADGAIAIMDGGIEGIQGHTVVLPATGSPTWARRIEGLQPAGKPGEGTLTLSSEEGARWRGWSDPLWALAPNGSASFLTATSEGPRWVWAIVMRRGPEARVLTGGGIEPGSGAPEPARSALAWLVQRVDAASAAAH
jgi:hypothetical protein